ncbi:hypothetical protein OnM2_070074, partial [Erysiphe neolycopersici]
MTELKKINSQHIKSMEEISAVSDKVNNIESTLNSRIVKIEQVVERITKSNMGIDNALVTNVYKGKEPVAVKPENPSTDNKERDPFSVPGLQSTWNPDRGQFKAPEKSPGPRTKTNLLCLSEPNVNSFCKTHRPTWPMTIEAVLQILSLSNNLRSPVDAFVAFRSGPLSNESTAEFLKRFEQAFHRMPTRERGDMEVAYAIEYTLQTHAGMVWSTLIQQGDAFPLHNALSIAWT